MKVFDDLLQINESLRIVLDEHPYEVTLHYTDPNVDEKAYQANPEEPNPYHHIGISIEEAKKLHKWLGEALDEVMK